MWIGWVGRKIQLTFCWLYVCVSRESYLKSSATHFGIPVGCVWSQSTGKLNSWIKGKVTKHVGRCCLLHMWLETAILLAGMLVIYFLMILWKIWRFEYFSSYCQCRIFHFAIINHIYFLVNSKTLVFKTNIKADKLKTFISQYFVSSWWCLLLCSLI